MKISTKARYGISALLDLAVYAKNEHVSLKAIAERQQISERYLEQVFSLMKKSDLVRSVKGPMGGYILGCDPNKTSAYHIIMALEGNGSFSEINETSAAQVAMNSALWSPLDQRVRQTLEGIMLSDLVNHYQAELDKHEQANSSMYWI